MKMPRMLAQGDFGRASRDVGETEPGGGAEDRTSEAGLLRQEVELAGNPAEGRGGAIRIAGEPMWSRRQRSGMGNVSEASPGA